jgi:hypothetical protein
MSMQASPRFTWGRKVAVIVCIIATLLSGLFGLRTYGSFLLLRSAYEAGAPRTSSIRPWMTLAYVAAAYRMPNSVLIDHLGLPPGTDPNDSLKTVAERAGLSPYAYTQRVQRVIADIAPSVRSNGSNETPGWFGAIGEQILTALLVYGYSALGLTLLLGAIGLPLPDGIATTVAGSLAAQGRMNWLWAGTITVVASVLGDGIGAVERIIQAAPTRIRGIECVTRIRQRDDQLRPRDMRDLVIDILGADRERRRFRQQISDPAQKALVCRLVPRLRALVLMVIVDQRLQFVAHRQQPAVTRAEIIDQSGEPAPEASARYAGAGQGLIFEEIVERFHNRKTVNFFAGGHGIPFHRLTTRIVRARHIGRRKLLGSFSRSPG